MADLIVTPVVNRGTVSGTAASMYTDFQKTVVLSAAIKKKEAQTQAKQIIDSYNNWCYVLYYLDIANIAYAKTISQAQTAGVAPNGAAVVYNGPGFDSHELNWTIPAYWSVTAPLGWVSGVYYAKTANNTLKLSESAGKTLEDAIKSKLSALQLALGALIPDTKTPGSVDTGTSKFYDSTTAVVYNVPSVKEAYFRHSETYGKRGLPMTPSGDVPVVSYGTNKSPFGLRTGTSGAPSKVGEAWELWQAGLNHKGMIQTYLGNSSAMNNSMVSSADGKVSTDVKKWIQQNKIRHGFQFLYNPTEITMDYSSMPDVDITGYLSGMDTVPPIGTAGANGSITFQILLNRMLDMRYYDVAGDNGLPTYKLRKGVVSSEIYDRPPSGTATETSLLPGVSEQEMIARYGTMYDIEYLLRTIIGFTMTNTITGTHTSDFGYLGAYPVELHLGQNLRYLVTIASMSIHHTAFDERMVPIFSYVDLTCNRLPLPYNANYQTRLNTDLANLVGGSK
jgi:hypothetical protein